MDGLNELYRYREYNTPSTTMSVFKELQYNEHTVKSHQIRLKTAISKQTTMNTEELGKLKATVKSFGENMNLEIHNRQQPMLVSVLMSTSIASMTICHNTIKVALSFMVSNFSEKRPSKIW